MVSWIKSPRFYCCNTVNIFLTWPDYFLLLCTSAVTPLTFIQSQLCVKLEQNEGNTSSNCWILQCSGIWVSPSLLVIYKVCMMQDGLCNLRCYSCAPCTEWDYSSGWTYPGRSTDNILWEFCFYFVSGGRWIVLWTDTVWRSVAWLKMHLVMEIKSVLEDVLGYHYSPN